MAFLIYALPEKEKAMTTQFWMLWPDSPALSIFVLALVALVFLYAARLNLNSSTGTLSSEIRPA